MYQLNCSSNNEGVQTFKMGSGNLGLYVIYEECAQKWSVLFRMCDLSLLHHVLNWCQLELKISSTTAQHGTIVPHSPGESPIRKNMYFCRGQSDISHRSAWQFARWYRALSRAWVGFSTFSGDMLGVSKWGKNGTCWTIYLRCIASMNWITSYNSALIRGHVNGAIHDWASSIAPIHGVVVVIVVGSRAISYDGRPNGD